MKRLAFALLLLSAPLAGQVEDVRPNSDNEDAGWTINGSGNCSTSTCETRIDEDPDSGGDNVELVSPTDGDDLLIGFATPSTCTSPAGTQSFDVMMSKCNSSGAEASGGGTPNYDVDLYCAGSFQASLATAVDIDSLDQLTGHDWTWDTDCSSDGSDVEIFVTAHSNGGGPNLRHACIEAIEWECFEAAAAATPKRRSTTF